MLKFLAFEQTFKNALTGLPMGGGKGGANFNPKGKSDHEVMRFCQSFMTELYRHVGADVDVPAGDIGVGGREIGYMFGQYKRITNQFTGVLTGKGLEYGGSLIRPEATGYGAVYFLQNMLKTRGQDLKGKTAVISGSGNVATHAAEKVDAARRQGADASAIRAGSSTIPTASRQDKIDWVKAHKTKRRGRISDYAERIQGRELHRGQDAVGRAVRRGAAVRDAERTASATMRGCWSRTAASRWPKAPTCRPTWRACMSSRTRSILYAPGKAANAGGVAVSGLEMSQNSERRSWKEAELQQLLLDIMDGIHDRCLAYGRVSDDYVDYVKGANIAGFKKVADAMLAYGVI